MYFFIIFFTQANIVSTIHLEHGRILNGDNGSSVCANCALRMKLVFFVSSHALIYKVLQSPNQIYFMYNKNQ